MIRVFPDLESVSRAAADYVLLVGRGALQERGRFDFVLSGGKTPNRAYEILAGIARDDRNLWEKTHFYWGDERCVPPDDPASNYRAAKIALLDPLGVRPEQVHRIRGEAPDPAAAAREYSDIFPAQPDLVLLGMGEDGHTASLFPGSPALDESEIGFTTSEAPVEPRRRITMTAPAIAAALNVLVPATGPGKADALRRVFARTGNIYETPARLVQDRVWFVDREAVGRIIEFRTDQPSEVGVR